MDLLGGPADGQRPSRLPPRARARVQGHLPALQDHARLLRRAQGRLGLPRARGRDRRPAAAGHREQARDRDLRDRRVQPALPRVGLRVPRGLERADRAHRVLDRPRRRLPHARRDLHRVRLVVAAPAARQGPALRGLQGRPLLHGVWHRPVEPRGGAGLSDGRRPERLRPPARRGGRRSPAGRRRAARLDHDALDAGDQRGGRRRPRAHYVRRRPGRWRRRSCWPRRWWNACSAATACGSSSASPARRSTACATAALRLPQGRRLRRARPHRPARGLRHGRRRHRPRAHRDRLRRGRLPPGLPVRAERRQPCALDGTYDERIGPYAGRFVKDADPDLIADLGRAGGCCARSPTSTPIRTAGAAATR